MQVGSSKIVVLGTGGTIAGRASVGGDNVGYKAGEVPVGDLLAPLLAGAPALAGLTVETRQVAQLDSKDMDVGVWLQLATAIQAALVDDSVRAVVVTHGTDTLEETAFFLSQVLHAHKPVVMTCAMRPASALVPDGPQNLLDAFALALNGDARGIWVVAAGWVHAPEHVAKVHTYRTDAFSSGDAGPMACVEEGRVRWFKGGAQKIASTPSLNEIGATSFDEFTVNNCPRVEVVLSHAGASGALVDALLLPAAGVAPLRGLVVAGTGNGTIHADMLPALARAQAQGVQVVRTTRCAFGQVVSGPVDVWPPAVVLSPVKARIALMLQCWAAQKQTAG